MSYLDLDFEKHHRLIPAVLQDADSDAVLMVGFMNRSALEKTLRTGRVTFLSRTRERLWTKGETSGNFAVVTSITTDCDRDALLVRVRVLGSMKRFTTTLPRRAGTFLIWRVVTSLKLSAV